MQENKIKLPELLCPAGTRAAFEAAVANGAAAVYLGAKVFNARANASNFSFEELSDISSYAHEKGVKIYLTLNTIIYDREMKDCLDAAVKATGSGADALIVADAGLCAALRREYPTIKLHASTQMSVHSADAGKILASNGFERAVLAREMSKEDIRSFTQNAGIESEVFIHGALCVCHSGQCLFSSIVGGRSGNRGECAQPCRLPYGTPGGKSYPLSLKDLSLCKYVPDLIDLGISSLKIEGRMKPADYVGAVTRVWRNLLDEGRAATDEEEQYLADIFSRSGFTTGYFNSQIDKRMLGTRTEQDKRKTDNVQGSNKFKATKRVLEPIDGPDKSELKPVSSFIMQKPVNKRVNFRSAFFFDPWQITGSALDYFDLCYVPLEKYAKAIKDGIDVKGAALPPVIYDSEIEEINKMLKNAKNAGLTDLLISNIGHLHFAKEFDLIPHGNFRLNVCNNETMKRYEDMGFEDVILSPELTLPRIRDIGGKSVTLVYGRIPLMITEKCVGTECGGCQTCESGKAQLVDRMGKKLPVLKVWKHRSAIFNCVPVYMTDKQDALREAGIRSQHFIFSTESAKQVDTLVRAFKAKAEFPLGGTVRRIQQK